MVTLCHLERFLGFLPRLLAPLRGRAVRLSNEVRAWVDGCARALEAHRAILGSKEVGDAARGSLMRSLGTAASTYRETVYRRGFSGRTPTTVDQVLGFLALCAEFLSHTIALARRPDGLFHSYNVLVPGGPEGSFGIEHLHEMLEGQVAALGTEALDAEDAGHVLAALARSRMYRRDQRSYLLYPDRRLPGFLEKNVIPAKEVRASDLLSSLVASGDLRIVQRDAEGNLAKALAEIVADPAIVKRFEELAITTVTMSSAEFAQFVEKQISDWAPALKAADIKP